MVTEDIHGNFGVVLHVLPCLFTCGEVMKTIEFTAEGDFEACRKAEKWCNENGFSVGSMQGPSPRGILKGDIMISKWRNMSHKELGQLDGKMTGDMRNGPVVVQIF
jgi:hypothetical protein